MACAPERGLSASPLPFFQANQRRLNPNVPVNLGGSRFCTIYTVVVVETCRRDEIENMWDHVNMHKNVRLGMTVSIGTSPLFSDPP